MRDFEYLCGSIGRSYPQSPGPWSHGSSQRWRAAPAATDRFQNGQRERM